MGEAISKEVLSELEAALRETDLKQETIDSIIRSLKIRRGRWLVLRWVAVVGAVVALGAVFYLGIVVGNRSLVQPVSNPAPQMTKESPSRPEATLPPVLSPEALDVPPSATSALPETEASPVETEPATEENVAENVAENIEKNIEDELTPSVSKQVSTASKAVGSPVIEKPKTVLVDAGSLYAVELVGFSGPKESSRLNKKLKKQGYSSSLHKIVVAPEGTVLHRVWIGHFKTPEKARKFVNKLRRDQGLEGKVVERAE